MSELKTKVNDKNVESYLNTIENPGKRKEAFTILALMKRVSGKEPRMWGDSIVGFGSYHYKYPSGQEGDWFVTGFAPRKSLHTVPLNDKFELRY